MPYYEITLTMENGTKKQGIRDLKTEYLENANNLVWSEVEKTIGLLKVKEIHLVRLKKVSAFKGANGKLRSGR